MNIFATVLTYPAPSANYRGESEKNRSVLQKVSCGRFDYPVVSPEAIRNALREILAGYGLPCNRSRLHDEEQLAVHFEDYPDPETYADDFLFGYLVAATGADRKKILAALTKAGRSVGGFCFRRDSILRMNMAVAVEPYRNNTVFTQSPLANADSPWKNSKDSALLHRETALTAFQYPFALHLDDCLDKPEWTLALLRAIGELNGVAGNHARSYYEMAPASIVVRLTGRLCAGYRTYGFNAEGDFPEVVEGILAGDYPGEEFWIGGQIVKNMPSETAERLAAEGVTLDRVAHRLLESVGQKAFALVEA